VLVFVTDVTTMLAFSLHFMQLKQKFVVSVPFPHFLGNLGIIIQTLYSGTCA